MKPKTKQKIQRKGVHKGDEAQNQTKQYGKDEVLHKTDEQQNNKADVQKFYPLESIILKPALPFKPNKH